ncbi:MAG: GntR family transcriptional regulator [Bauldia sp.]|nr:GntR family transcriptional regulator [Bauldia sp.]
MVGPSPLYDRVADRIREQISNGAIAPNSRIPSERILAETFGVSRVTVRQALKELESAGLVEVVAGARWARSSIVDPDYTTSEDSIEEGAAGLVSFSHLAQSNGLKATAEVLTNETRASTLDEADLLGIAPGAPIVDLVRLRYLDSIPTLIDFSLLPEGLAPGIGKHDFSQTSLYQTLAERYGLNAARADCIMEARGATEEAAAHLGLAPGAPVLVIVQKTFSDTGRIIQWCRSVYRGDRYRFRAILDGLQGTQRLRPLGSGGRPGIQPTDRTKEPAI